MLGLRAFAAVVSATVVVAGGAQVGAAPSPPTFEQRYEESIGPAPNFELADFDEDGNLDVAAITGSAVVTLAIGDGDGHFAIPDTFSAGGTPTYLRVLDVDEDGHLDLALGMRAEGFSVLLGEGDGSFAAPKVTATNADSIAFGHLDGDADLDAVAGSVGLTVMLTGNGDGTFETGVSMAKYAEDGWWTTEIVVADFEGDGDDDVAALMTHLPELAVSGNMQVYLGDGTGSFTAGTRSALAEHPQQGMFLDIDEDGDEDIVARGAASSYLDVYRTGGALGPGEFPVQPTRIYLGGSRETSVVDLDDDGHLDLAVPSWTLNSAAIYRGHGGLDFEDSVDYTTPHAVSDLEVGDLDSDGILDLVSSGTVDTALSVFLGRPDGSFRGQTSRWGVGTDSGRTGTIADVNGDGRADAVSTVASPTPNLQLSITLTNSRGELTEDRRSALPVGGGNIATADIDHDGDTDVLTTSSTGLTRVLNDGSGTFASPVFVAAGTKPGRFAMADVNGDGDVDAVVTDPPVGALRILLGDGAGAFGTAKATVAGTSPVDVLAADLDRDGDQDLAVLDDGPDQLLVLRNEGAGTFASATAFALGGTPVRFDSGDLDGDGYEDLAASVLGPAGYALEVRYGDGTGAFGAAAVHVLPELPAGWSGTFSPKSVVIGDVNLDGAQDVVFGGNLAALGSNDRTLPMVELGGNPYETPALINLDDIDGDGLIDIIGSQHNGSRVMVRRTSPRTAPWAPFPSWTALVDRLYRDVGDRAPTAEERAAELDAFAHGARTPAGLVARLRTTPDQASNVDTVVRLYRAYFLRSPDPSGLDYWLAKRRAGTTLASISSKFATSSEFRRRYGKLTNRQFVERIYLNVLGRPGEASGVDFWTKRLDTKRASRGQVMVNFSESNEYRNGQASEVEAAVLYLALLGKAPTTAQLNAAVALLDGPATRAALADQIIDSPAYATHVGG